jgi:maleylpyruvate isomerase
MLETTAHEPLRLLPFLRETVQRLRDTVDGLDEQAVRAPSLLPGWTRAHVLAHLAGCADSRVRLLSAAATGRPIPQYRSEQERAEQIEADARQSAAALRRQVRDSLARAVSAIAAHPAGRWHTEVEWLGGIRRPAHRAVSSLVQELEIHHVDLAAGYGPADWPGWFVADESRRVLGELSADESMPPIRVQATDQPIRHDFGGEPLVTGPAHELLAWLIGRSRGERLTVTPAQPLPALPPWRQ